MAISTDKIQLVASNEGKFKDLGSEDDSSVPYIGKTTVIDLSGNPSDQVYTTQHIPFVTIIPIGELLNDTFWYDGYSKFCKVHELKIIVDKNTIPSVSGMKIVGYATSTSKAGGNTEPHPASPNGTSTSNNYPLSSTIMFKLWREFAWEFQENQEPYKPFLRKAQGGDIETFCSTQFPNSKLGLDFNNQASGNESTQTMYKVLGLDIGTTGNVVTPNLENTVEIDVNNWDDGFVDDGQGKSIQTYPLIAKIQHNQSDPSLDPYSWAKIKGLITLY